MEKNKQQLKMMELNDLPENCISTILSLTSPLDACRSSVVSSIFKSASESDELWDKFLPSNYHENLSKSVLEFPSSKKELYMHLSNNPILIEGGNKSFQIEKRTGKKCFMIGARLLDIAWGDDDRYWTWRKAASGFRFAEVTVLHHVWWLEIRGKIDTRILSRNTTYVAYLVFSTQNPRGLDYASSTSVKFVGGGRGECSGERAVCYFAVDGGSRVKQERLHEQPRESEGHYSVKRRDGLMEIELGDFFNGEQGTNGEVEMSLMEVKSGSMKSGLIVQGIEVRPKGSKLCSC